MSTIKVERPETYGDSGKAVNGKGDHLGPVRGVLRETIAGDTASSAVALKGKLPPYSRVTAVHMKCSAAGAAFSGGTSPTDIGLGTSSDPDHLCQKVLTSMDAVGDEVAPQVPDTAMFTGSTEQALQLSSLATGGGADGDIVGGEYDIAVWYETYPVFKDAS